MDVEHQNPLSGGTRQALGGLMSLTGDQPTAWPSADLAAIWRHQMNAPLLFDLGDLAPNAHETLSQLTGASTLPLHTFADLLNHPRPPVELLLFTKEFAKAVREGDDPAFPVGPATVLYFGAIAVALLRCNRRITQLDSTLLEKGLRWCAGQEWLDPMMRLVFDDALCQLHNAGT